MRVEVFRETVRVNIRLLQNTGNDRAMGEFLRIALGSRQPEMTAYECSAQYEGMAYTKGAEVLSYDENTAIVSIYFDIEDETKAIYFKMLIDPTIKS